MKLPRLQLTVRLLMALVAVVGLILGGVRARQHYLRCLSEAAAHEKEANSQRKLLGIEKRLDRMMKDTHEKLERYSEESRKQMLNFDSKIANMKNSNEKLGKILVELDDMRKRFEKQDAEGLASWRKNMEAREKEIKGREGIIAYEERLKSKYRRAAYRPWEAIAPDPPPPDPEVAARFWLKRRDYGRALAECQAAIAVNPEKSEPHNHLAWLLATCPEAKFRDGPRAVRAATRALELTKGKSYAVLDTLAAAHAEAGDFAQAIASEEKALDLLVREPTQRQQFLDRLSGYHLGKPHREEP